MIKPFLKRQALLQVGLMAACSLMVSCNQGELRNGPPRDAGTVLAAVPWGNEIVLPVLQPPSAPAVLSSESNPVPVKSILESYLPTFFSNRELEKPVPYSRVVRAAVGQLVEIPFRGSGWVYLGEVNSQQGINYDTRRLDNEGQNFVFQAEATGTYGLKFYKQDFIQDYVLNDYVQVIVGEAAESSGNHRRVIAEPRGPVLPREIKVSAPVVEPAAIAPLAVTPDAVAAPVEQPAAPPPNTPPIDYLQKAGEEYGAGRSAEALSLLEQFRVQYPLGSDEAWWLYGQVLEADSPVRDIRSALDYYRRLVREYPQSSRYADVRRRIAYLERYYFNIQ
ncbi:MAG: tetratricopeptide repeat protein [Treponema sp.]|jgi:hypothetical protein|nr:tetratricopeptide repeat protein [Treponema sp.]